MIRISITAEAFAAIEATIPFERLMWLEPHMVNKLRYLRGPGESYSDVILKLVELEAKGEL